MAPGLRRISACVWRNLFQSGRGGHVGRTDLVAPRRLLASEVQVQPECDRAARRIKRINVARAVLHIAGPFVIGLVDQVIDAQTHYHVLIGFRSPFGIGIHNAISRVIREASFGQVISVETPRQFQAYAAGLRALFPKPKATKKAKETSPGGAP